MTTITSSELIQNLTDNGFEVQSSTYGEEYGDPSRNIHLDIQKSTTKTIEGHVEFDEEGKVIEAFVIMRDEDGNHYVNRDMTVFIDEGDCNDVTSLTKRFVQAMP